MLEQRPGLGAGATSQRPFSPFGRQQPIDGRRADRKQLRASLAIQFDLVVPLQNRDNLGQDRGQPFAADETMIDHISFRRSCTALS